MAPRPSSASISYFPIRDGGGGIMLWFQTGLRHTADVLIVTPAFALRASAGKPAERSHRKVISHGSDKPQFRRLPDSRSGLRASGGRGPLRSRSTAGQG